MRGKERRRVEAPKRMKAEVTGLRKIQENGRDESKQKRVLYKYGCTDIQGGEQRSTKRSDRGGHIMT